MTLGNRILAASLRGGTALRALALLGAGLGAVSAATPIMAQDITSGSLNGTVLDQSGKPVAGATVTLVAVDRGFQRTVTTSSGGLFTVNQLPVGVYSVTIAADGFPQTRTEGVQVALGGTAYTFRMAAATAENASAGGDIVVTGRAERTVDFSSTATGQVFNVQEVASRLPVARNIEAIQLLAPQATSGDAAFGGTSFAGSSVAENITYVNGMNVTNFRTFVGGTTIPFEFYDSVQIKTGGYQAEFGRNTGGASIALTRSGSNEFRGGWNAYWNPDGLRDDAPNTYNAYNRNDKRNVYEGNIWASGPIIKDRLFFFAFLNPRNTYQSDTAWAEGFNAAGTVSTGFSQNTVTERFSDTPFYGGKIDLNVIDGHRVELTYFNDSDDEFVRQTTLSTGVSATTRNFSGGSNLIARYSGAFTDWLSVSALYGRSRYNQTVAGSDDGIPYVLDGRSGTLVYVAGNPNGTIATGRDQRENFRGDVDVTLNLLGQHRIRFGGDYEKLNSVSNSIYSGGIYYRYYRTGAGASTVNGVSLPARTEYVRARFYDSGGSFNSNNLAFYAQDSWDVTGRLNLSLGLRYDRFRNYNASNNVFTNLDNQFAPRVGFAYDLLGDRLTKFTASYGRYYLPVAANTNIRMAGNELFYEDYFRLTSTTNLVQPALGTQIGGRNILSDSSNVDPRTLVSQNLKPQYMDEFIAGLEHRVGRWNFRVNGIYRTLGAVLEDTDTRYSISAFCRTQNLPGCNATNAPTGALSNTFPGRVLPSVGGATIGSGGYVLLNPGSDLVINADLTGSGQLTTITVPAQFLQLQKAKRDYKAMEFLARRDFDGKWALDASYVLSALVGNYEGGVKSDNGQSDTGLTQDFDEPGWTDGAYGYLPNHRRHTFKINGTYALFENLLLSGNVIVQSPRKFGCYGTYPYADGRASVTTASSWYCSNPLATGLPLATPTGGGTQTPLLNNPGYTAPVLIGRAKRFEGDWLKNVNIGIQYRLPLPGLDGLTVRADVFNVFNSKDRLDFVEAGDLDSAQASNPNYRKVSGYQSPRYVRLGISMNY